MIPNEGDALALHKKYGSNERIVNHCKTVARVSTVVADAFRERGKNVDTKVVLAASLLHDIGRTRIQTVAHGLEGSRMLEKEGVDPRVVEAVRKHVGAGLSKEEAKSLGLPDLDYIPRTLEERIVCFADKMVDSNAVRAFDAEVQRFVRKGHDADRLIALKNNLADELGADPDKLVLRKLNESH